MKVIKHALSFVLLSSVANAQVGDTACCADKTCGKTGMCWSKQDVGWCNNPQYPGFPVECPNIKCCPTAECKNDPKPPLNLLCAMLPYEKCLTTKGYGHVCSGPNKPKTNTNTVGKGHGDPHFVTWSGKNYDFHGACDLVFTSVPDFGHGLGLDIHIRTSIKTWWSYISNAVVKIGEDTLEVSGGPKNGEKPIFWVNGKPGSIDDATKDGDLLETLSGYKVHYKKISPKQSRYRIDLGNGEAISIDTFNEIVNIVVKAETMENFGSAVGLMGNYPLGEMIGRENSTTAINDPVAFGKEWQVLETEAMLFHTVDGTVQHPTECAMPSFDAEEGRRLRRRLGEAIVTEEDAQKACSHVGAETDKEACVFDVMAINDVEIALTYEGA